MLRLPFFAMLALLSAAIVASAQTHPAPKPPASARAAADTLGMTCAQVLEMSSSGWVEKFTQEKGTGAPAALRAINAYAKCYDARTDRLAASLARSGRGPLMGARGDFADMEKSLKDFAALALKDSDPPADSVKSACAVLYEKQFRYEFYHSYEPKPAVPPAPAASSPAPSSTAAAPSAAPRDAAAVDPVTQAKNRFGALLNDLPNDKMHRLHAALGAILGTHAASSHTQLLVYRYAIFLLEPPGNPPFAPPPF